MRMRNLLYGGLLWLATCYSCASRPALDYVIEGEIKGYGNGMFHVVSETLDDYVTDSVFVKDDRFTFRSSAEHPERLLFIPVDNEACNRNRSYSFRVFVENSATPVLVKADVEKRIENAEITGSELQRQFEQIEATGMFKRLSRSKWVRDSLAEAGDTVAFEEKKQQFDDLAEECLNELFAFDFAHNSTAVVYTVYQYFPFLSIDKLEKVLQRFDPAMETSVYLEKMQEQVRRARIMQVGKVAPDFTLDDTLGNKYRLSDFKGRMILLDFTASWCHWCKVEIPFIEKVYDEMKGKDFEIISVYLDKKREDWVKDVEKSNHPWKCLSDVMAWKKGGMAYDYFVGGIPCLILLDKEGRIVSKGMRGEETIKVIRENYK